MYQSISIYMRTTCRL